MPTSLLLTAQTTVGRDAIREVMRHSYSADLEDFPPAWARALVVDGVPVSFILVDPDRHMAQPAGGLRYAFISDVATRETRRGEGHFRHILEHTFDSLRAEGVALAVTHGRCELYRRFGFDVFTYHCGVFADVSSVERSLGTAVPEGAELRLDVVEGEHVQDDLLLVEGVRATTWAESKDALLAAAELARKRNKQRMLFEDPRARGYGSRYPFHASLETRFAEMAKACGACVCVQGAEPEGGSVPDADWIKVLDARVLVEQALRTAGSTAPPNGAVCISTDAGSVAIETKRGGVSIGEGCERDADCFEWPSSALGQLVTGYLGAETLSVLHGTPVESDSAALLNALFPRRWRLSRNESWALKD